MESTGNNAEPEKNNHWGEYLLYQGALRAADTYTLDLVRHLVFISSILVGFLFTVISDLVISPQNANDSIITAIFSCLMISSFSLFASIIVGAIFQYLFNIETTEQLHSNEQIISAFKKTLKSKKEDKKEAVEFANKLDEHFKNEVTPLLRFILGATAFVVITFLIGIFFFIISFILIGWIHSSFFVLIAFALSIGLGLITLYSGYKTISLYLAYRTTRSGK